jgi:hypothetical protein
VQLNERSVIALVRNLHRINVLPANHTFIADGFIGPCRDRLIVLLQPDICQQSRLSTIAVLKRMNLHRTMMQSRGLFDHPMGLVFLPVRQVIQQLA